MENTLLVLTDYHWHHLDQDGLALFLPLGLTAKFYTVGHDVLTHYLIDVGIQGTAL